MLSTTRTDPDEPDSSIRLLPWVFDGEALIGLPYAAQRLGHTSPDLRPVRALLIRVSLGPRPRSIASATGKPVLFGDFTATMAESDFS